MLSSLSHDAALLPIANEVEKKTIQMVGEAMQRLHPLGWEGFGWDRRGANEAFGLLKAA